MAGDSPRKRGTFLEAINGGLDERDVFFPFQTVDFFWASSRLVFFWVYLMFRVWICLYNQQPPWPLVFVGQVSTTGR